LFVRKEKRKAGCVVGGRNGGAGNGFWVGVDDIEVIHTCGWRGHRLAEAELEEEQ